MMATDYNIPMMVYEKLMFSILEEYDEKFKRLSYIVNHVAEKRYELPNTVKDKVTLRMGGVSVYITKAPQDLFDIEYKITFRLNYKQVVKFINLYMLKHSYFKFNFENYIYKEEFINNLSEYIYQKYNIKTKSWINGGYVQFDITTFVHSNTKIIYVGD